jgi:hypothetical protein
VLLGGVVLELLETGVVGCDDPLGAGAGVGRGVTGRRERLATDRKSPVGAMARGARGRRAKA